MELFSSASGFFGPSLLADITLTAEIFFYLILSAGVVAQLLGKFKIHAWLQAPVVILRSCFKIAAIGQGVVKVEV